MYPFFLISRCNFGRSTAYVRSFCNLLEYPCTVFVTVISQTDKLTARVPVHSQKFRHDTFLLTGEPANQQNVIEMKTTRSTTNTSP